ncbi:MAG: iron export ABC transporter permease subunit FetB [Lentisphaeria bacterium]|nr:iron export ABC transporter permease subunit FetB [Candidatus Neomarinimicrobiota bacterium]MCF7842605.1 iron export ABC transporter permease subunit FetB [Lentisphaeria bacterium]
MSNQFYVVSWWDVLMALVFVALTYGIMRYWKIGLEKTLLVGTVRTFLQLTLMGYLLSYIFKQESWYFMVGLLILMVLVASIEGYRRQKLPVPHYFLILVGSLGITVVLVLGTILKFILDVEPWYYPFVMIPIAGMIIGNGLNSMTLTANRFIGELKHREGEVEMLLSLGAPVRTAVHGSLVSAIRAALIPNINNLMTVGLVQLPGMMSGQILAGIDPLIAVRYQIIIMYMWITTAVLADVISLTFIYRQFFTAREQLRINILRRAEA